MQRSMLALVLATGVSSMAHAGIPFASGKVYGGPSQTLATCYLYNAGTAPVTLTGLGLRSQTGAAQRASLNTCGASLAGGQGCTKAAYIMNNVPWDCSVKVSSTTDLRGSLEIRQYEGSGIAVVLQSQPMR